MAAPYALGMNQLLILGERYKDVPLSDFHTAYLQMGSLPFSIMQKYLDDKFDVKNSNDSVDIDDGSDNAFVNYNINADAA